jgi:PAS domain S-box-containing protein
MSEAVDRDLRSILDALPVGIAVHRHRRILYANRALVDTLGLERVAPLLGSDPLELLAPEDREEHAQRIAALARGEAIHRALGRLAGEGGRSHLVELADRTVEVGGEPAMVTIVHDVTEQRALEEQLRRARKLEDLGKLAVGIAHDFNNLVTVILSCAEALREAVQGGSGVDPEEIDEIRRAGERGRDLTRRLLALANDGIGGGRGGRK